MKNDTTMSQQTTDHQTGGTATSDLNSTEKENSSHIFKRKTSKKPRIERESKTNREATAQAKQETQVDQESSESEEEESEESEKDESGCSEEEFGVDEPDSINITQSNITSRRATQDKALKAGRADITATTAETDVDQHTTSCKIGPANLTVQ